MNYINFAGWLLAVTWVVADTVPRYIMPRLYPIFDTLEELHGGGWGTGKFGIFLSMTLQILLSLAMAWLLTAWSTWCVLRCYLYTIGSESRFSYFLLGFICCEYALCKMAKADRYRGFFMSIFHFTIPMGAFVVFTIMPQSIKDYYPWLLRWMGLSF